jgi:hypothetical protein
VPTVEEANKAVSSQMAPSQQWARAIHSTRQRRILYHRVAWRKPGPALENDCLSPFMQQSIGRTTSGVRMGWWPVLGADRGGPYRGSSGVLAMFWLWPGCFTQICTWLHT